MDWKYLILEKLDISGGLFINFTEIIEKGKKWYKNMNSERKIHY